MASKQVRKEGTELVKAELLLVSIHRAYEQSLSRLVLLLQEEGLELLLIDIPTAISIYQLKDLLQLCVNTWVQSSRKQVAFVCISAIGRYMLGSRVDFTPRAGSTASWLFNSCRGSNCSKRLRIDLSLLRGSVCIVLHCALSFLTNLFQRDELREFL